MVIKEIAETVNITPYFPGGASGKEPTCQYRRHKRPGFDPWVKKIPWRIYSCWENPRDRGAWWATIHGVTKSRTELKWFSRAESTTPKPLIPILTGMLLLLLSHFSRVRPLRPHRRQPTRLPRPWDSLGKNTGVGCHFLLQCMKVKSESEVVRSCPTLGDPQGLQPSRLLCPWDFPGKCTGVGCHCLLRSPAWELP